MTTDVKMEPGTGSMGLDDSFEDSLGLDSLAASIQASLKRMRSEEPAEQVDAGQSDAKRPRVEATPEETKKEDLKTEEIPAAKQPAGRSGSDAMFEHNLAEMLRSVLHEDIPATSAPEPAPAAVSTAAATTIPPEPSEAPLATTTSSSNPTALGFPSPSHPQVSAAPAVSVPSPVPRPSTAPPAPPVPAVSAHALFPSTYAPAASAILTAPVPPVVKAPSASPQPPQIPQPPPPPPPPVPPLNCRKKKLDFAKNAAYLNQSMALPILGSLSAQIFHAHKNMSVATPEVSLCRKQLRDTFRATRKMFSPKAILDVKELGIKNPEDIETIRMANMASICASAFEPDDMSLIDQHDSFLQSFIPGFGVLTQDLAALFINLKHRTLVHGILELQDASQRSNFLDRIFPINMAEQLRQLGTDAQLTNDDLDFVKNMLLAKAHLVETVKSDDLTRNLLAQYSVESFQQKLSSYLQANSEAVFGYADSHGIEFPDDEEKEKSLPPPPGPGTDNVSIMAWLEASMADVFSAAPETATPNATAAAAATTPAAATAQAPPSPAPPTQAPSTPSVPAAQSGPIVTNGSAAPNRSMAMAGPLSKPNPALATEGLGKVIQEARERSAAAQNGTLPVYGAPSAATAATPATPATPKVASTAPATPATPATPTPAPASVHASTPAPPAAAPAPAPAESDQSEDKSIEAWTALKHRLTKAFNLDDKLSSSTTQASTQPPVVSSAPPVAPTAAQASNPVASANAALNSMKNTYANHLILSQARTATFTYQKPPPPAAPTGASGSALPPNQSSPSSVLYQRARQAAAAKSTAHARREGAQSTRQPWTPEEEQALMAGLDMVKGPHWSQILQLFGVNGSMSDILRDRSQVQLKDKARNLKLFFLKTNSEMPYYLKCVTGELKTRAPSQAARKEAAEAEAARAARFVNNSNGGNGNTNGSPNPAAPQPVVGNMPVAMNAAVHAAAAGPTGPTGLAGRMPVAINAAVHTVATGPAGPNGMAGRAPSLQGLAPTAPAHPPLPQQAGVHVTNTPNVAVSRPMMAATNPTQLSAAPAAARSVAMPE